VCDTNDAIEPMLSPPPPHPPSSHRAVPPPPHLPPQSSSRGLIPSPVPPVIEPLCEVGLRSCTGEDPAAQGRQLLHDGLADALLIGGWSRRSEPLPFFP
jgi:hypothetical protein